MHITPGETANGTSEFRRRSKQFWGKLINETEKDAIAMDLLGGRSTVFATIRIPDRSDAIAVVQWGSFRKEDIEVISATPVAQTHRDKSARRTNRDTQRLGLSPYFSS